MARAKWKFNFYTRNMWKIMFSVFKTAHNKNIISSFFLLNKTEFFNNLFKKKKFYSRSCNIPSFLSEAELILYKGKHPVVTKILNNCIGYKFGEFAFSRKPFFFTLKEKKKKNLKR